MYKLFCSAFAMCLMVAPVWGEDTNMVDLADVEAQILPELSGPQGFTPADMHQKDELKVEKVILDKGPLKGQGHSLIPWSELETDKWLSVDQWLYESELKSKHPDWPLRLRDNGQQELVGKVLSCRGGNCPIFRGTMPVMGQHLSRLLEGDEIRTEKDTVAWIFLMDGTLVRLGPLSSLSLQEINLGKTHHFLLARLNKGHVFWHPRGGQAPSDFGPETDAQSLPLRVLNANQEHFERQIFNGQNDSHHLNEVVELDEPAVKAQLKEIESLRTQNDLVLKLPTRAMIIAPNVTLIAGRVSFDLVSNIGGQSYFKKRAHPEGEEFSLQVRGHSSNELVPISESQWYEVSEIGRSYTQVSDVSATLQFLELLTRRIKTLELAREIWIKEFSLPVLESLGDPKKLAIDHGYSLWGEDSKKRFDFLYEYTRRIETTNLRSIENLLTKLKANGQVVKSDLDPGLYSLALNHYLKGLKTRYNLNRMQVRQMSDLQYYIWILRNGKL
jgi:hypothetical protein